MLRTPLPLLWGIVRLLIIYLLRVGLLWLRLASLNFWSSSLSSSSDRMTGVSCHILWMLRMEPRASCLLGVPSVNCAVPQFTHSFSNLSPARHCSGCWEYSGELRTLAASALGGLWDEGSRRQARLR